MKKSDYGKWLVALISLFSLYILFVFPQIGLLPKFKNLTTKNAVETHFNASQNYNASKKFNASRSQIDKSRVMKAVLGLHVPFVKNVGQTDKQVAYTADMRVGKLFVTNNGELVYTLKGRGGTINVVRETVGANDYSPLQNITIHPGSKSSTKVNYLVGKKRLSNLPTYSDIKLEGIADKINLTLRAYNGKVEKVFEIFPGGDPNKISVKVDGTQKLEVKNNKLYLTTKFGEYVFSEPVVYQEIRGKKIGLKAHYRLLEGGYSFDVEEYDINKPLYIDPVMYGTYLGGGGNCTGRGEYCGDDSASSVFVYNGDVYVAGISNGGFPTTSGAYRKNFNGGWSDVVIVKLNGNLNTILSSTYFGGSGDDKARSLYVTSSGVYVAGETKSDDFPVTSGGVDISYIGGGYFGIDAFISRLSLDLSTLLSSTYLGGHGDDKAMSLFVTDSEVFVAGWTESYDFPNNGGVITNFRGGFKDAFLSRLSLDLSSVFSSTYLGGRNDDEATSLFVTDSGVYVVGDTKSDNFPVVASDGTVTSLNGESDAFVSKLSFDLSIILSSSYLGGNNNDKATSLFVTDSGVYVAGETESYDFPVTSGGADTTYNGGGYYGRDAFVSRLSLDLSTVLSSTYLGGSNGDDSATSLFVTDSDVYVTGRTKSNDFPVVTSGGVVTSLMGYKDAFIGRLSLDLSTLLSSTYLGGNNDDEASSLFVTDSGVYIAGETASYDFPVTSGRADKTYNGSSYYDSDGDIFVSKLSLDLNNINISTYIGGGGYDGASSLFVTSSGIYVAGWTESYNFPSVTSGGAVTSLKGYRDVFVSKLSSDLSRIDVSTYLGGSLDDEASSLFVADSGVFVVGSTDSDDFPVVTSGGVVTSLKGYEDAFISRLSLDLSTLLYSVYLGGSNNDEATSLFVTDSGLYVAGETKSDDFPVTSGGVGTSYNGGGRYGGDAFVSRLSLDLSTILSSTYLGGSGSDYASSLFVTDSAIYVAGWAWSVDFPIKGGAIMSKQGYRDAFVSRLSLDLSTILSSTYLGGSREDYATSLFVTDSGVFVAGWTEYYSGNSDAFVSRLSLDLSTILSSTYLGGSLSDHARSLYVTDSGVYVAGWTQSHDFPNNRGVGKNFHGGYSDAFLSELSLDLSGIIASGYLGGSLNDGAYSLFVTDSGVYVAGWTQSGDFFGNGATRTSKHGCDDAFVEFFSSDYFINNPPVINSFSADTTSGIVPFVVTLTVDASDPDGDTLSYYYDCYGDGRYWEHSNSNTDQCFYDEEGIYHSKVRVEDPAKTGYEEEITITAIENIPPVINSFSATPLSGTVPLSVNFSVSVTDENVDSLRYRWDFNGDGYWDKIGSLNSENYTYRVSGVFTVTIEVDDGKGGSDTATVTIKVKTANDKNYYKKSKDESFLEKALGCGCSVGDNGGNYFGDLLVLLLPMLLWIFEKKRKIYRGG